MNVLFGIIRWVELNNPIYSGNIQPPCGYIRTQENAFLGAIEFEKGARTLLLLLLAVNILHILSAQIQATKQSGQLLAIILHKS